MGAHYLHELDEILLRGNRPGRLSMHIRLVYQFWGASPSGRRFNRGSEPWVTVVEPEYEQEQTSKYTGNECEAMQMSLASQFS